MIRKLILSLLLGLIGCGGSSKIEYAKEHIFYFKIKDDIGTEFSKRLKDHLEESFPKNKYAITNSYGLYWPFYQEFDLDRQVPKDSLMPPHTHVHLMAKDEEQRKQIGDRMMQIIIFPEKSHFPAYSMTLHKWDSLGWVFFAQTGIHPFDSVSFSSDDELINQFEKSIIRFSFK